MQINLPKKKKKKKEIVPVWEIESGRKYYYVIMCNLF